MELLTCPECGRRSLEFTTAPDGVPGYLCRCGYGYEIGDDLDEAYADPIEDEGEVA